MFNSHYRLALKADPILRATCAKVRGIEKLHVLQAAAAFWGNDAARPHLKAALKT